jgi:ABC-type xylose transport system substrate-binding protein
VPTLQFPATQVTVDNYQELLIDSGYMNAEDLQ